MPSSKIYDALYDWRAEQKAKMPGEPAIMFPSDKVGIVTYGDGSTKVCIRADDLLEIFETR